MRMSILKCMRPQCISDVTCMENDVLSASDDITGQQYQTDSHVAVVYDALWYIGSILDYNPEDNTYPISFTAKGNNQSGVTLKCPEKEVCWRSHCDILYAVDAPVLYGKTRRLYKLTTEDLERVQNLFKY